MSARDSCPFMFKVIHPITNKFTNTANWFQAISKTFLHHQPWLCQCTHTYSHFLFHAQPHSPSFSYDTTTLPICRIPSPYICQFFSLFYWLCLSTKLRIAPQSPASTAPGAQMLILKGVVWVCLFPYAHTMGFINGTQVLYKRFVNETLEDGGGGAYIHTITALHFTHWIPLKWHDSVHCTLFTLRI